jgi:hypothetical protein
MPEANLFLLFTRRLNELRVRYMARAAPLRHLPDRLAAATSHGGIDGRAHLVCGLHWM